MCRRICTGSPLNCLLNSRKALGLRPYRLTTVATRPSSPLATKACKARLAATIWVIAILLLRAHSRLKPLDAADYVFPVLDIRLYEGGRFRRQTFLERSYSIFGSLDSLVQPGGELLPGCWVVNRQLDGLFLPWFTLCHCFPSVSKKRPGRVSPYTSTRPGTQDSG